MFPAREIRDNMTRIYNAVRTPYYRWYASAECKEHRALTLRHSTQRDVMQDHHETPNAIDQHQSTGSDGALGDRLPSRPITAAHPAVHPGALARFYMTSDLRAATGLTRTHLDFYLREGVILPTARTESGYLLFDDAELGTLRQVIAWRQDGVGIREIRARLARDDEHRIHGGGR